MSNRHTHKSRLDSSLSLNDDAHLTPGFSYIREKHGRGHESDRRERSSSPRHDTAVGEKSRSRHESADYAKIEKGYDAKDYVDHSLPELIGARTRDRRTHRSSKDHSHSPKSLSRDRRKEARRVKNPEVNRQSNRDRHHHRETARESSNRERSHLKSRSPQETSSRERSHHKSRSPRETSSRKRSHHKTRSSRETSNRERSHHKSRSPLCHNTTLSQSRDESREDAVSSRVDYESVELPVSGIHTHKVRNSPLPLETETDDLYNDLYDDIESEVNVDARPGEPEDFWLTLVNEGEDKPTQQGTDSSGSKSHSREPSRPDSRKIVSETVVHSRRPLEEDHHLCDVRNVQINQVEAVKEAVAGLSYNRRVEVVSRSADFSPARSSRVSTGLCFSDTNSGVDFVGSVFILIFILFILFNYV